MRRIRAKTVITWLSLAFVAGAVAFPIIDGWRYTEWYNRAGQVAGGGIAGVIVMWLLLGCPHPARRHNPNKIDRKRLL